jgi:hypothetical protein
MQKVDITFREFELSLLSHPFMHLPRGVKRALT